MSRPGDKNLLTSSQPLEVISVKLVVTKERRFDSTPDGRVWTPSTGNYEFWTRYLEVFDEVRVLARVRQFREVDPAWKRADGPGVSFAAVPYYLGPVQYLLHRRRVAHAVRLSIGPEDAAILRIPSVLATHLEGVLRRQGRPIAVEVVANPYDVFSPGSAKHPARPFFRWWFPRAVRRQCAHACAAAYVTAETLQRHYPASPRAFVTSYSSVELTDEAFVAAPRPCRSLGDPIRLLLVGSLDQMYKGVDVLIDAAAVMVGLGLPLRLTIVGDGKHRGELEAAVRGRGLAARTCFTGNLPPGGPVRAEFDRADLFVMPSRTEGLPRVLIEAMARGLPCVGSNIGGIPELLSSEELVPPGDAEALAEKIAEVLADDDRRARLSARNLDKARAFHASHLQPRRRKFYEVVREANLAWQREHAATIKA